MSEEIIGWELASLTFENDFGNLQTMRTLENHPVELVSFEFFLSHVMDECSEEFAVWGQSHLILEIHVTIKQV